VGAFCVDRTIVENRAHGGGGVLPPLRQKWPRDRNGLFISHFFSWNHSGGGHLRRHDSLLPKHRITGLNPPTTPTEHSDVALDGDRIRTSAPLGSIPQNTRFPSPAKYARAKTATYAS